MPSVMQTRLSSTTAASPQLLTGKVLMCKRDASVLTGNRESFEAFTLLMCCATVGNTRDMHLLLDAGLAPIPFRLAD